MAKTSISLADPVYDKLVRMADKEERSISKQIAFLVKKEPEPSESKKWIWHTFKLSMIGTHWLAESMPSEPKPQIFGPHEHLAICSG